MRRRRPSGSPRGRLRSRRERSRSAQQRRLGEQRAERVRFERMPSRAAGLDVELVEDRLRLWIATPVRAPLGAKPLVKLVEAVVGVEQASHDELRRYGAVPAILLQ